MGVDTGHEHREEITTTRNSDNGSLVKTTEKTDKKKSEDYFLGLLSKIKGKLKRRRGCGGKGCGRFNAGGNAFGQIGGSASGGVNAGGQGQLGGRFNAGIQGQSQFSGGVSGSFGVGGRFGGMGGMSGMGGCMRGGGCDRRH